MPEPDDGRTYAVVELMGHRMRPGAISDAQLGGATLLRIEHPSARDNLDEPLVEYYAPSALFSIRPCTRDEAIRLAEFRWPTEADRTLRALASVNGSSAYIDSDDDYEDVDA